MKKCLSIDRNQVVLQKRFMNVWMTGMDLWDRQYGTPPPAAKVDGFLCSVLVHAQSCWPAYRCGCDNGRIIKSFSVGFRTAHGR